MIFFFFFVHDFRDLFHNYKGRTSLQMRDEMLCINGCIFDMQRGSIEACSQRQHYCVRNYHNLLLPLESSKIQAFSSRRELHFTGNANVCVRGLDSHTNKTWRPVGEMSKKTCPTPRHDRQIKDGRRDNTGNITISS